MNVLDENVQQHERVKLTRWRIHTRKIGVDLGRAGMQDIEIIPLLHELPRPTLFARDPDFYRPSLRHPGYCLVWLDVSEDEPAEYIRRFLKHPDFNTIAKRLGHVVQVTPTGLHVWRPNANSEMGVPWPSRK